jgi:uncharacterized membrane protein
MSAPRPSRRTIRLHHERLVEASAERVWSVLADYARDPLWRTGVESMTVSPPGMATPGAHTTERLRLAGMTWCNDGVVTEVEHGRRLAWQTTSGAAARGARAVDPSGADRCRVQLDLEVTPRGLERLAAPFLARLLRRNLERDLDALALLVAGQSSAATASPSQSSTGVGTGSSSVAAASAAASTNTPAAAAYSAPPTP